MILWWVKKYEIHILITIPSQCYDKFSPLIFMKKWWKCDELVLVLFMFWKIPPCCSTQWWMKKLSLKQNTDNLNGLNVTLFVLYKQTFTVNGSRLCVVYWIYASANWNTNLNLVQGDKSLHQVVPNLLLTSKLKLCFSICSLGWELPDVSPCTFKIEIFGYTNLFLLRSSKV